MDVLEITQEERSEIFSVIACLMFLINISPDGVKNFYDDEEATDTPLWSALAGPGGGSIGQAEALARAAYNLGVDKASLNALLRTVGSVRSSMPQRGDAAPSSDWTLMTTGVRVVANLFN